MIGLQCRQYDKRKISESVDQGLFRAVNIHGRILSFHDSIDFISRTSVQDIFFKSSFRQITGSIDIH